MKGKTSPDSRKNRARASAGYLRQIGQSTCAEVTRLILELSRLWGDAPKAGTLIETEDRRTEEKPYPRYAQETLRPLRGRVFSWTIPNTTLLFKFHLVCERGLQ